jgi:hypothetical protein
MQQMQEYDNGIGMEGGNQNEGDQTQHINEESNLQNEPPQTQED